MNSAVTTYLNKQGYSVNAHAGEVINLCQSWYKNEATDFHKRKTINGVEYTLPSLNFAKRCCADDANLCEVVEINAGENETKFQGVLDILADNRFDTMYRKQLEMLSACGTVGGYIRLDNATMLSDGTITGGAIKINYVDAGGIIPLTVVNDEITECGFCGTDLIDGKEITTLVMFTLENGLYVADTHCFNKDGKEIADKHITLQLGDVKPFFIMKTAEVNNLDNMTGYGLPKLYTSLPIFRCLDLAFNVLFSDLDKGEKMIFINELLCEFREDGSPIFTPEQKRMFMFLGEKLPQQDTLYKEYNPEIRIQVIKDTFETCLSLLSMSFGYGTKKYTFENGQIKTATEYIGERQDAMQELNKQRAESESYIKGIVNAIVWFSNKFSGTTWDINEEISIEFDDSYVNDRLSEIENMRMDAIQFANVPEFTVQYVMLRLNCEREEAIKHIQSDLMTLEEVEE
jgi:A118 family predicted phage portal protein